jgi:hypothetical protein
MIITENLVKIYNDLLDINIELCEKIKQLTEALKKSNEALMSIQEPDQILDNPEEYLGMCSESIKIPEQLSFNYKWSMYLLHNSNCNKIPIVTVKGRNVHSKCECMRPKKFRIHQDVSDIIINYIIQNILPLNIKSRNLEFELNNEYILAQPLRRRSERLKNKNN